MVGIQHLEIINEWGIPIVAVAILFTIYELHQQQKISKTELENRLNEEFRSIWKEVHPDLILNEDYHLPESEEEDPSELDIEEHEKKAIYSYIDITNQQIFLRKRGRISRSRWKDWEQGIQSLVSHPPINQYWEYIKNKTDRREDGKDFEELRSLESPPYDFDTDPYYWGYSGCRRTVRWLREKLPII